MLARKRLGIDQDTSGSPLPVQTVRFERAGDLLNRRFFDKIVRHSPGLSVFFGFRYRPGIGSPRF
jgi:hypothetical protein